MNRKQVVSTLTATGQSAVIESKTLDIALSGTWAGTVALQRKISDAWVSTGDSWTANVQVVAEGGAIHEWRLDWTRLSGTLAYDLRGE